MREPKKTDEAVASRLRTVLSAPARGEASVAVVAMTPPPMPPPAPSRGPAMTDLAAEGSPLAWSDIITAWPEDVDLGPAPGPTAGDLDLVPGFPRGEPGSAPGVPDSDRGPTSDVAEGAPDPVLDLPEIELGLAQAPPGIDLGPAVEPGDFLVSSGPLGDSSPPDPEEVSTAPVSGGWDGFPPTSARATAPSESWPLPGRRAAPDPGSAPHIAPSGGAPKTKSAIPPEIVPGPARTVLTSRGVEVSTAGSSPSASLPVRSVPTSSSDSAPPLVAGETAMVPVAVPRDRSASEQVVAVGDADAPESSATGPVDTVLAAGTPDISPIAFDAPAVASFEAAQRRALPPPAWVLPPEEDVFPAPQPSSLPAWQWEGGEADLSDVGDGGDELSATGAFGAGKRSNARRNRLFAFDPGRRGVRALAAAAAVVILVAAFLAWRARPRVDAVAPPSFDSTTAAPSIPSTAGSAVASGAGTGAEVVIAVAGKVAKPGLVRLPAGARVADALTAAGGASPGVDVSMLNLARKVVDGELILVGVTPSPGQAVATGPAGAGSGAGAAPGGLINLNTAALADLDTLPGVGPVLAQRILDARQAQGGFKSVSDLRKVDGIGDARYEQLKDLVTV